MTLRNSILCRYKYSLIVLFLFCSCDGRPTKDNKTVEEYIIVDSNNSIPSIIFKAEPLILAHTRERIKLGHAINTVANEYLPVLNVDGSKLYFSSMDRTGFFDFKLDYVKDKSAGGEDIYSSNLKEGVWTDARPIIELNTNGHEVVTQVFSNGDLVVTANYPENLGVEKDAEAGFQTTDIFLVRKEKSRYQIIHLPEPINSIFTEADGWIAEDQSYILFVSDRPENVGEYHKKGWKWNESFWGNSDVYVSFKNGDYWSIPVNLGPKVNTPFAERTPFLSSDGLTLYLSSNGYRKDRVDLDVFAFRRKTVNDWTNWEGPFSVEDANTLNDDWGYKETGNGDAYVASSHKLNFKPTQLGAAGDGGARETNYRPGYELYGLQIASLNSEFESNIYHLQNTKEPNFIASDVFFKFNSSEINKFFEKYLLLLADQIMQNEDVTIEVNGHTDDLGKAEYNIELSKKRAEAVRSFLVSNGVTNPIVCQGFGDQKPIVPNTTSGNRIKNRRVEIFFK